MAVSEKKMPDVPVDPAFKVVPKGKSCFHIWRVESLKLAPVPKDQYGSFYTGDSYILLSVQETKGALDMHIHFWLGSESSQDEMGVAAYKTVELDDYLGGGPVQHREVQDAESARFMSYFKPKGGIKYMKGGAASGFNHVEKVVTNRLLHVKGKINIRCKEVSLSWDSFNDGDVFILDLGTTIFLWYGQSSSRTEKLNGLQIAQSLRAERGHATVVVVQCGEESKMSANERELWNRHLPLSEYRVKKASEVENDEVAEKKALQDIKLFRCSDAGGTLTVTEVKSGPLAKADLDSNDTFIIDNGTNGVWVWNGKRASQLERKEAMANATGFAKKKGYPEGTHITRVSDGGEPTEFKALFKTWPVPAASGKTYTVGKISKTVQTKFDASTLHGNPSLAAETQMVDDGSGVTKVWRIEKFDMVPVEKYQYGQFFGGDSYVVQYTYLVNGKENYIIYYWQGLKSTADERGTAALKAVELDDKVGGAAVQVRVVQGKEPPHFMTIFGGRLVIYSGGKAGWSPEESNDGPGDTYLLHVRGTSKLNTKAVQVPCRAASLNSNDVFVLFTKTSVMIWNGKGSTGDERQMASVVAKLSPREPEVLFEGQEKDAFWTALGGKEPYANDKRLQEEVTEHVPRLFQCSNASGQFRVEQTSMGSELAQQDLCPEDVMLLDTYDALFLWIGEGANIDEKKAAEVAAIEYLKTDPSGRDEGTPIIRIKQGHEPPHFTGYFGVWDSELWSNGKTFEQLQAELGKEDLGVSKVSLQASSSDAVKYTYQQLAVSVAQLPAGVDPLLREVYLKNDEFRTVFGMTYEDFLTKPAWKQKELKKARNLF